MPCRALTTSSRKSSSSSAHTKRQYTPVDSIARSVTPRDANPRRRRVRRLRRRPRGGASRRPYKLSIVERADDCETPGEIGALLLREGLYSSRLSFQRVALLRVAEGCPGRWAYARCARPSGSRAPRSTVAVLCSQRFADPAPAEVYATLLDERAYLCSERTMYRILAENRAVRKPQAQRRHPNHPKPEVVARASNECGLGTSPVAPPR